MPGIDLKFTYHRFNREDGQYGFLKINQSKSFFRKIWIFEFQQLIFHPTFRLSYSSGRAKIVHDRCVKMKRVTATLEKDFVCKLCVDTMEGVVEPSVEISFFDLVYCVKSFCFWGNTLNASSGSEAAVTARTRIGRIKFLLEVMVRAVMNFLDAAKAKVRMGSTHSE